MNYTFNNSSIVSVNSGTIVLNVSGKTRTFVDSKLVSAVDGNIVLDLPEPIYNKGNYLVIDLGNTHYRTFILQKTTEHAVLYYVSAVRRGLCYDSNWSIVLEDPIRNATPEEIQELNDQLAAKGKCWNPDTMQIEKLRWKPKENTKYFHIIITGGVAQINDYIWRGDKVDRNIYKLGNYFKTKEEAEAKLEQIKKLLLEV